LMISTSEERGLDISLNETEHNEILFHVLANVL